MSYILGWFIFPVKSGNTFQIIEGQLPKKCYPIMNHPYIFISYSRRDLNFAQKIVDALAENNLDTWIDWKSIPKGDGWDGAYWLEKQT